MFTVNRNCPSWLISTQHGAVWRSANGDAPIEVSSPEKLTSKAEALQALKDSFAAAEKAAATMTPQNAFEGMGPKKTATRAALASAIAWHTMDHYGQLVIYARMNGVIPPQSR